MAVAGAARVAAEPACTGRVPESALVRTLRRD